LTDAGHVTVHPPVAFCLNTTVIVVALPDEGTFENDNEVKLAVNVISNVLPFVRSNVTVPLDGDGAVFVCVNVTVSNMPLVFILARSAPPAYIVSGKFVPVPVAPEFILDSPSAG
jgi:hypothetical protein